MAAIPLAYDVAALGYDYGTGRYDAASLDTLPASMTPQPGAGATITPA